jgi:dihydroorotase-like cyclic amidohydrolase
MNETIVFQTDKLHLDDGEIAPAQVKCTAGEALEIRMGKHPGADITLPDDIHIALARADTHVHFRESVVPSREEFEDDPYRTKDFSYENLLSRIATTNQGYDAFRGSLAALKGGVWLVGAMGNTPWAPVGEDKWSKMDAHYRKKSLVFTHVWPRLEPGVPPIKGQEEKDFAATFGRSGLSDEKRRKMYLERPGGMISYHNDKSRSDETLQDFKNRVKPKDYLLQPLYFDGGTVYEMQKDTLLLAIEAKLHSLLTRHIPTGTGLEMILRSRIGMEMLLPAEVGLDYLYFNFDMLKDRETRSINYRRPALPSQNDQSKLIEILRDCARLRDPLTFIGSDHAPHNKECKMFKKNGMPGSPGTRVIEHSLAIQVNLIHNHDFSYGDIDWLTAIVPSLYISQYRSFPFAVGTMQDGAMTNLAVFHPDEPCKVDEAQLQVQLRDPHYHTAYKDENLHGQIMYTVVNGVVYDVRGDITALNTYEPRLA